MKVGTKSVLFGAHQFLLHPWFVAAAWWRLYGFLLDPRLWLAFFAHDIGYLGKPNMDGPEGERHVELGARILDVFGREWGDLCRYHSRYYAKRDGRPFSRLCVADKLAIVMTPAWLYLPLVRLTGEIAEYMRLASASGERDAKYASMRCRTDAGQLRWYLDVQEYLRRWVDAHKGGAEDTWTPDSRQARTTSGVWR